MDIVSFIKFLKIKTLSLIPEKTLGLSVSNLVPSCAQSGTKLCPMWYQAVPNLVPSYVQCGTKQCPIWYQAMSYLVPSGVQSGTKLCPIWYQAVPNLVPSCVQSGTKQCPIWYQAMSYLVPRGVQSGTKLHSMASSSFHWSPSLFFRYNQLFSLNYLHLLPWKILWALVQLLCIVALLCENCSCVVVFYTFNDSFRTLELAM
jgi:hypothetical protein